MAKKKKIKSKSFEQIQEKYYGKKGTPKRNKYDKEVLAEIRKEKKKQRNRKKKNKKKKSFKLKRSKSYNTIYKQIERIKPMIANILKKDLESRDDDNILLIRVWKKQRIKENMSFKEFKYKLIMGKIALPETIMRARRLIQANPDYAHLRGKLYAERHNAEETMKTQLKLFEDEN